VDGAGWAKANMAAKAMVRTSEDAERSFFFIVEYSPMKVPRAGMVKHEQCTPQPGVYTARELTAMRRRGERNLRPRGGCEVVSSIA